MVRRGVKRRAVPALQERDYYAALVSLPRKAVRGLCVVSYEGCSASCSPPLLRRGWGRFFLVRRTPLDPPLVRGEASRLEGCRLLPVYPDCYAWIGNALAYTRSRDRLAAPIARHVVLGMSESVADVSGVASTGAVPSIPAQPASVVPLLAYQREDVESAARFRWNCWSRQTGKSFTKSLRRILRGLARGRHQIFLSAGERQSRELMQKTRQHCQAMQIASTFYDNRFFDGMNVKQLEIVLPRGVRIIALPANPQTARGFTGDVFLDEFAMHEQDRDIWAAMFPSLLRGDGELDVASTPKGRDNVFYRLRDNERFSKSTVTLPDAVSQGLDVDIEAVRSAMGDDELYRQEFLCEFLDGATAFLSYDQIDACMDRTLTLAFDPSELAGLSGDLFVGVDIGRVRDLTAIWVLAAADDRLTTVALFELHGETFRTQFETLAAVLTVACVRRLCIDAGGLGMQLAEQLVERFGSFRVVPVTFTVANKSQLATALRLVVEQQHIAIPHDDRIRRDWHSVERSVTSSGHLRLSAPRREGSHADRFWAAALALHAAKGGDAVAESLNIAPIHFARTGAW